MKNWEERDEGRRCSGEADWDHVRELCAALEIPCTRADFVKQYWNDIFRFGPSPPFLEPNTEIVSSWVSMREATPPTLTSCVTDTSSSVHYITTVSGI